MASDPRAGADVASHQREEGGSLFDGAVAFQEALHAVAGMKLEGPLPKPMCVRKPPGPLKACGLPLRRLSDHGTKLVTFVDILIDQPPFDWDKLEEECLRSNYDALPEALTLGAKPGIPYTMQVFVVPDGLEEAATCTVVKHVCFRPNKVHLDTIRRLCRGLGVLASSCCSETCPGQLSSTIRQHRRNRSAKRMQNRVFLYGGGCCLCSCSFDAR